MALRATVATSNTYTPDDSFAHEQSTVDLLNFMERAANTIKMALDNSSRPRRNTNQKRYLQRQMNNLGTTITQRKLKSTHHAKLNRRRLCKVKTDLVDKNSLALSPHQNIYNAKNSGVKTLEERNVDLQTASRSESVLRIQDSTRSSTNTSLYVLEKSRSPNNFSPSLSRDRNHFLSDSQQSTSYSCLPSDTLESILDQPDLSAILRNDSWDNFHENRPYSGAGDLEKYQLNSCWSDPNSCWSDTNSCQKYALDSTSISRDSSESYRHCTYITNTKTPDRYRHGSYTPIPESSDRYRHGSYTPNTDVSSLGTCSPQSCSDSSDSFMLTSPLPALSSCLDYQCGQSSAGSELNRTTPCPEHAPCRLVYADQMSPSFHDRSNMEINTNVFLQDSPAYVLSRQRNELYSPHQMMPSSDSRSCAYHPLLHLPHPGSSNSLPNIDSPKRVQHPREEHSSYRNEDSYRSPHFPNFLFVNSSSVDKSFLFSS